MINSARFTLPGAILALSSYRADSFATPEFTAESEYIMKSSMVAIQLWRWFLFHVFVGAIPILVSVLFPRLFAGHAFGLPKSSEVLFLTLMLSSLTFGDVFEAVATDGLTNIRLGLIALLFLGVILSLLLYGANNISPSTDEPFILEIAVCLAALFFIVGTLVQWVFWKDKQKEATIELNGEAKS
jgi:hypothetical protein